MRTYEDKPTLSGSITNTSLCHGRLHFIAGRVEKNVFAGGSIGWRQIILGAFRALRTRRKEYSSGSFPTYNQNERIEQLDAVTINPTALRFEVTEVSLGNNRFLAPKECPHIFHIESQDDKPYYRIEDEGLGISIWADKIIDLEEVLHDDIAMLWKEFVLYEGELTDSAKKIKEELLSNFSEITK